MNSGMPFSFIAFIISLICLRRLTIIERKLSPDQTPKRFEARYVIAMVILVLITLALILFY